MKRRLQKITVKGNRAFHYFDDDGKKVRIPCTLREYHALGEKDAAPATHPRGLQWLHSAIEPEFDTPDGDLPENSYADLNDNPLRKRIVKVPENPEMVVVDEKVVVNDEIEI